MVQLTNTQIQTILKNHDGYFIAQYHQVSSFKNLRRTLFGFVGWGAILRGYIEFSQGERRDVI